VVSFYFSNRPTTPVFSATLYPDSPQGPRKGLPQLVIFSQNQVTDPRSYEISHIFGLYFCLSISFRQQSKALMTSQIVSLTGSASALQPALRLFATIYISWYSHFMYVFTKMKLKTHTGFIELRFYVPLDTNRSPRRRSS